MSITIVKTLMLGILCSMSLKSFASHLSLAHNHSKRFSFSLKDTPIQDVMHYNVHDAASPQQTTRTVTGVVLDANGECIIGATVVVKGNTAIGTSTDVNGVFTLNNVPANAKQLTISYIGYASKDVAITSGRISVTLVEDSQMLDAVVVTGMTKMDKRLFTGAATQLNAEGMKLDGVADISRSLEGRVAGVSVQNVSGTFGTAPKIKIRGATSIHGSSKPLWVVDGVIMENVVDVSSDDLSSGDAETMISNAIAGLNASDIESFDILKDGSATSIYGAKAMAGVIVVTTKRGKSGKTQVNYNGEFTTRLVPRYAEFNIMNSQDQMGIYQELYDKGYLNYATTYRASNSGVYGKMYQMLNEYNQKTGSFSLADISAIRNAYLREAEMRNTDWFNELFDMSIMHNHSLSVSGGTDKTSFYGSVSMMVDPGWYKASNMNRYTASMKLEHKIHEKLTASIKSNLSYRQQKAPGTLGQSVREATGEVSRGFDINPYSYSLNTSRTLDSSEFYTRNFAPFNILHELNNNYLDFNVVDLIVQGELRWNPIKSLTFSALGAMKYSGTSYEHHIKDNSNQALAYRAMDDQYLQENNTLLYTNPDVYFEPPISILPSGGIYNRTDRRMKGFDFRLTGDYNFTVTENHIMKLFGGMEMNSADKNKTWFRGMGRQYANGDIAMFAWEAFKQMKERTSDYYNISDTRDRGVAFFGMFNYSYKGRYNLNMTGRYEGSNRLGKSRRARWLPTWNFGGAWNAHEEEWFNKQSILSHASIRASYSLTADRGPSSVSNAEAIIRSAVQWRPESPEQEAALEITDIANYELTYEKKHELNMGIDLGFLKNRINLSTDVYYRNNYDLIGAVNVMGLGGVLSKMANVASMKSHGIDVQVSVKNIAKKNFSWTTDYIFSNSQTKVTNFLSTSSVLTLTRGTGAGIVGYPHRAIFSIPYVGLDAEGAPLFINESGEVSHKVNFEERSRKSFLKYEGPVEPTIYGSLGNIWRYKNFRFNLFLTYSFGNKIRLDSSIKSGYSDLDATPKEFKNRWMMPGDEKISGVLPAIVTPLQKQRNSNLSYAYTAYNYSTERIADGGFVRLKEISVSYDMPSKWVKPVGLNNLSLKLQGTNLFLLYADSKLNGQDPEFVRSGGVSSPMAKQITATINLGF